MVVVVWVVDEGGAARVAVMVGKAAMVVVMVAAAMVVGRA